MNLNMPEITCDPELLEALLRGELSDGEERQVTLHLNHCQQCRRLLSETAADPEAWIEAERLLQPMPFDAKAGAIEPPAIKAVLSALGPTDDPQMLGRLGGYEIAGVVGSGGMGVVLKALDRPLNRTVAIKVLAPHLATSGAARKRFEREARAAAAVLHPNVVAIHSVSGDEPLPYLVMPYLRGPSLQKRLDDEGLLALQEVLRIGSQVAAGLAAAHAQGLVHRDITPSNILLEEGVERVALTDFGLARAIDDATITKSGVIAGTPQYMSPEQARGESVDPRSDLFSLGSVLYAMCTGRPPFRAETSYGVLRRITDDEPPPPREINPDVPDWLARIIARLMAKNPADRYSSAAEVAELLEQCLAHVQHSTTAPLPASLAPATAKRRVPSLTKRSFGALAMIAALSLGLLGLFVWQSTDPPDISGRWSGDGWGQVVLEKKEAGAYAGSYTDTFGKEAGRIELSWSRIERRFKGTWRERADRFGKIAVRLVDGEIRGAWTADNDSRIQPGTPELADLLWKSAEKTAATAERGPAAALPPAAAPPLRHETAAEPDHAPLRGGNLMDEELRFSEATEVVLAAGSMKFMLDFDSGQTMDMPARIGRPEERLMDVLTDQVQPYHFPKELLGRGLEGVEVKASDWDTSASEVRRALAGDRIGPLQQMDLGPEQNPTYFFRTRDGGWGILQLLEIVDDPKGIRLRYKTLASAASKAVGQADAGSPAAAARKLQGVVLDVQVQELVEISLGDDDGLRPGRTLNVFRDDVYLGTITVVRVEADKSVARIDSRTGEIRRGDYVGTETRVRNTVSLPQPLRQFSARDRVTTIACSPDGNLIAAANGNPTFVLMTSGTSRLKDNWKPIVQVFDGDSGREVAMLKLSTTEEDAVLAATERVFHFEVTAMAFSTDGSRLAVGTSIGQVKLFDSRTGELITVLDDEPARLAAKETPENWKSMQRAIGSVRSLAFSPDGSLLAICGESFYEFADIFDGTRSLGRRVAGPGRLKVWDVKSGAIKHDLVAHSQVFGVALSAGGEVLASTGRYEHTGGNGNGLLVWDAQTGNRTLTIAIEANGGTHAVVFSPTRKQVAIGSRHFDREKDTNSSAISLAYPMSGTTDWQRSFPGYCVPIGFSIDGNTVAILCGGKSIQFVSVETGEVQRQIEAADSNKWNDADVATQADRLVIGGADKDGKGVIEIYDINGSDPTKQ